MVASGCVLRRDGRGVAYAIDTGVIVGGAAMMYHSNDRVCEGPFDATCEFGTVAEASLGAMAIAAGVLAIVVTAFSNATRPIELEPATAPAEYARPSDQRPRPSDDQVAACTPAIAAWLREPDLERKTELYGAMPDQCRAAITRPADETH